MRAHVALRGEQCLGKALKAPQRAWLGLGLGVGVGVEVGVG